MEIIYYVYKKILYFQSCFHLELTEDQKLTGRMRAVLNHNVQLKRGVLCWNSIKIIKLLCCSLNLRTNTRQIIVPFNFILIQDGYAFLPWVVSNLIWARESDRCWRSLNYFWSNSNIYTTVTTCFILVKIRRGRGWNYFVKSATWLTKLPILVYM